MFEEVPRDRHGVARLLPIRRVVLGPFVVGGGLLLAAVGGSVAVAATVITASTIGATDVPPRPSHSATASIHQHSAAKRSQVPHPTASPSAGRQLPAQRQSGLAIQARPGTAPGAAGNPAPSQSQPIGGPARPSAAPRSSAATSSVPSAAPSSTGSEPAGNAVIYIRGYDKATGRVQYQFATARPGAGGNQTYQVTGTDTFSATPAAAIAITSGGTVCPPAGSSCTLDQLISAADFGFFAEVAIDADGQLRSVHEVGSRSTAAKLAPSSSAPPSSGRPQPSVTNPPPTNPSPAATS